MSIYTLFRFICLSLFGLATTLPARASDRERVSTERPNVLFIAVDDLNHWCGYTGRNPQAETPNIDRLSALGMSFTNAHCAAPACNPSRAALMSGIRPSTSGCYLNGHPWRGYISEGITLNATFQKAGYYVMGTGKIHHGTGPKSVYLSEWDEYPPNARPGGGGAEKYQGYFRPLPLDMQDEDLSDWHSVDYCIEQLQKKRDQPFFLACGLIKPHLPWAVPRKYYEMFPRDEIELPPHIEDDLADIPEVGRKIGSHRDHAQFLKLGRWKDAVQSYLATIAYTDVCVGRLLDAFEDSPASENTIVVLWGDHGWHLGEKQHWRKFTLWEEATRAPMIWYAPGLTQAGTLCDRPVDFTSIYPTLCELAGIEAPDHLEGPSIVPLLRDPHAKWEHVALTTHGYMNHAVRTQRWRYIRYENGEEELYDHSQDQYEWKNLAGDEKYADEIEQLRRYLPMKNAEMRKKK